MLLVLSAGFRMLENVCVDVPVQCPCLTDTQAQEGEEMESLQYSKMHFVVMCVFGDIMESPRSCFKIPFGD